MRQVHRIFCFARKSRNLRFRCHFCGSIVWLAAVVPLAAADALTLPHAPSHTLAESTVSRDRTRRGGGGGRFHLGGLADIHARCQRVGEDT